MQYIQDIILNKLNCNNWHSIYAERPSKLFEGAEVLLSISIISKNSKSDNCYITGLRKWYAENRNQLFSTTHYNQVRRINDYIIPKISDIIESKILKKIQDKSNKKIGYYLPGTKIPIVYEDIILRKKPDYLILLSWHISDELIKNIKKK